MSFFNINPRSNTSFIPAMAETFMSSRLSRKTVHFWVKSVQNICLHLQIQGEINAPDVYAAVRDRMSLLPTRRSIYKQQITVTAVPGNFSVGCAVFQTSWSIFRFLNLHNAYVEHSEQKYQYSILFSILKMTLLGDYGVSFRLCIVSNGRKT